MLPNETVDCPAQVEVDRIGEAVVEAEEWNHLKINRKINFKTNIYFFNHLTNRKKIQFL